MNERTTGISFDGLLGLLFIGLKLGGVIDWSWWWVLAPFWLPLAVPLALAAVVLVLMLPVLLVLAARRNNGWTTLDLFPPRYRRK